VRPVAIGLEVVQRATDWDPRGIESERSDLTVGRRGADGHGEEQEDGSVHEVRRIGG
jgi:hypothetical protein